MILPTLISIFFVKESEASIRINLIVILPVEFAWILVVVLVV